MFEVPFREQAEALEVFGCDIFRMVGLVLCDPRYNTRLVKVQKNSAYEHLSIGDMKDFVVLITQAMELGPHGRILCSSLQFKSW